MTPAWVGADRLVGGRYALEALIGRGGMGEVWRARHVALDTLVAIKLLLGAAEPSERARRRFLTEARVTATLKTRYAVHVFDFGVTDDGLPYLVMELLEGDTLSKRIAREGRLAPAATSRFLQKAARALEKAHALGIVHRDFKPENVMLVADEEDGGETGEGRRLRHRQAGRRPRHHAEDRALGPRPPARRLVPAHALGVRAAASARPSTWRRSRCGTRPSRARGGHLGVRRRGVRVPHGPAPFEAASVGQLIAQGPRRRAAPAGVLASPPCRRPSTTGFVVACARDPRHRFADVQTAALALASALDPSQPRSTARASLRSTRCAATARARASPARRSEPRPSPRAPAAPTLASAADAPLASGPRPSRHELSALLPSRGEPAREHGRRAGGASPACTGVNRTARGARRAPARLAEQAGARQAPAHSWGRGRGVCGCAAALRPRAHGDGRARRRRARAHARGPRRAGARRRRRVADGRRARLLRSPAPLRDPPRVGVAAARRAHRGAAGLPASGDAFNRRRVRPARAAPLA